MKERPILFSAPMVRALLAGTKTQTRRVVKPQPRILAGELLCWKDDALTDDQMAACSPYGQPGDRLWVREAFRFPESIDHLSPAEIGEKALAAGYPKPWCPIQFEADGLRRTAQEWRDFVTPPRANEAGRLRAGMHMPRWASRITLEVTGVRVERLQDISEADAIAEGIERVTVKAGATVYPLGNRYSHDAVEAYSNLWEQINGPESWATNPWVWIVEFRRLEAAC
ncbi:MAG: hypothetical protein NDI59_02765 [Lysobacter sp.]|nr:hypothetical protein [Lysobacter sp.]